MAASGSNADFPIYQYLWESFHFATILQAAGISQSVWSAWSLPPLSCAVGGPKAPASWTHSIRFAPFGCGRAALRCIADFQSAARLKHQAYPNILAASRLEALRYSRLGNLRYFAAGLLVVRFRWRRSLVFRFGLRRFGVGSVGFGRVRAGRV